MRTDAYIGFVQVWRNRLLESRSNRCSWMLVLRRIRFPDDVPVLVRPGFEAIEVAPQSAIIPAQEACVQPLLRRDGCGHALELSDDRLFRAIRDEKALADGITKSCQKVKTNGETAAGARQRIEQNFSIDTMVRERLRINSVVSHMTRTLSLPMLSFALRIGLNHGCY